MLMAMLKDAHLIAVVNVFLKLISISRGYVMREQVLTSLSVESIGLGSEGFWEVCSALKVNTTLTSLHLLQTRFDYQSIASFGKFSILYQ